jgi:hypothetical protein
LRDSIFATGTSEGSLQFGDDWETILKEEGARVEISDASRIEGLGEKTAEFLRGKGINVVSTAPATGSSTTTIIRSYTTTVYTTRYLSEVFGVDSNQIYVKYIPDSPMDITLVIGADWARKGVVQ